MRNRMGAPLVIGIDFRPALSRATGVGRYFQGLVGALARLDRENRYVLFSSSLKERASRASRPPNFELVDRRVPVRLLNALWHRAGIPTLDVLSGRDLDIAHSPTPLLLPSRRARSVVTVCDLFFLDHPESTEREIRRDYAALARKHTNEADAVVAISETTRREVVDRLGVPAERVAVVHAGVDERFLEGKPKKTEAERDPYVLAVATEEPRKNLVTLIEAFSGLTRRGFPGRLTIAGAPGLDTPRILERIQAYGLGSRVERLGYVTAEELPSLFRGARCLVMPSVWEGFGMPIVEAMACDTPVIASDIPVHREVSEDAAVLVSPEDPEALAAAIEKLWSDETLRRRLVEKGRERARLFSWSASAARMLEIYRKLA